MMYDSCLNPKEASRIWLLTSGIKNNAKITMYIVSIGIERYRWYSFQWPSSWQRMASISWTCPSWCSKSIWLISIRFPEHEAFEWRSPSSASSKTILDFAGNPTESASLTISSLISFSFSSSLSLSSVN